RPRPDPLPISEPRFVARRRRPPLGQLTGFRVIYHALEIADDEFVHSSSPCARRGMASARSGSVASRRPLALWRCLYMNVVRRGFSTTRPAAAPRAPPTASPPAGIAADGRTRRAQRSRGAACAPLALDPAR